MHASARSYVERQLPPDLEMVVEFGSRDVNGNVNDLLPARVYYLGIDPRGGPNVDVVCDAAEWEGGEEFDLVLCLETLEHTPNGKEIIEAAHRALRPGGLLIATMAAPERLPHNMDGEHGEKALAGEHYANISEEELRGWLTGAWRVLNLEHHPELGDLYVTAQKP